MAALAPNGKGGLGIRRVDWRERYGQDAAALKQRDAVAQWLSGFAWRVGIYVSEAVGKQDMDQILHNISNMRPPERNT